MTVIYCDCYLTTYNGFNKKEWLPQNSRKKEKKCIGVKNKLIYDKVVLVFVQSSFLGTFLNKSSLSKSFVISVFKLIACYMKNNLFSEQIW